MPRQKIKEGDIFEILLENGEKSFGQILSVEPGALNSVGLALWEPSTYSHAQVLERSPVAVLLATPDLLKRGTWPIIDNAPPIIAAQQRTYEQFRPIRWIGVDVIGSGIVVDFMRACAGLYPWNKWANPQYLDGLLFASETRPARAVLLCS